jgi:hemoglobin
MRAAVDSLDLTPTQRAELWAYLERAAHFMVNTVDDQPASAPLPLLPRFPSNAG